MFRVFGSLGLWFLRIVSLKIPCYTGNVHKKVFGKSKKNERHQDACHPNRRGTGQKNWYPRYSHSDMNDNIRLRLKPPILRNSWTLPTSWDCSLRKGKTIERRRNRSLDGNLSKRTLPILRKNGCYSNQRDSYCGQKILESPYFRR